MSDVNDTTILNRRENAGEGPPKSSLQPRDASYALEYAEDGVFVVVEYEDAGGKPLQAETVAYDLGRRNIEGINADELPYRLRRRDDRIRIADAQEEPDADSDVMVFVAKDEMSADMVLLPPCVSGSDKTADEIRSLIKEKWGVTNGLDEAGIKSAVEMRLYNQRIPIAEGKLPEKGADGKVVFLFNTTPSYAPKIAEDGSADYKDLNIFEGVMAGATVVSSIPAGEGTPGYTVKGAVLPAQKGLEPKLPKGKNVTVSDDGLNLVAAKSGRVDYINGRVEISDVFRVPHNVDMGVGNIQFEGDVIISGNVITGLTVEAAGMIEVWGYVEGATLIAGKDIILKNGMQGMDKGRLNAGGNVVAKFLERCEIDVKGSIYADYIVQCKVISNGSITMKGKWGKIIGGTVSAGKEITASIVGSPSNEPTVIELGASPELRARCTKLEAARNQLKVQLDKINNVARVIPTQSDSPERLAMRQKLVSAKDQLQQQYNDTVAEIEMLTQRLSEHSGARLNVTKAIYPNVKVIIDSCSMTTKSVIDFATFVYREGEVTFNACEVRP